jgi:hypothetical protein
VETQIIAALKKRPMSARAIAKRIRRRASEVHATCAQLAERGVIERQGDAWALASTARCTGTNAEGKSCGNLAVIGTDRCAMHQENTRGAEPRWRYPWTHDVARRQVTAYRNSPYLAGRWRDQEPSSRPKTIEESFAYAGREARRWLEFHDAEWLTRFDAGEMFSGEKEER